MKLKIYRIKRWFRGIDTELIFHTRHWLKGSELISFILREDEYYGGSGYLNKIKEQLNSPNILLERLNNNGN